MEQAKGKNNFFQYIVAVASVCLVFAIMQGIHDNYGIMLPGIILRSGIDYASVSFVIAVGQILYGATQPVFGMLAIKKGNAFVMFLGIAFMAVGLIVIPFCGELWSLLIFFGILLPAGTGALCFGIVMGALAPIIGEKRAAVASGIVQASAGVGDAIMSPLLQHLTNRFGVAVSMPVFSLPILMMLPV
ncbi:MAG: MFS transporter, partial [Clostridium sp.]|nr:MFS transporter [Clostridium sp.]